MTKEYDISVAGFSKRTKSRDRLDIIMCGNTIVYRKQKGNSIRIFLNTRMHKTCSISSIAYTCIAIHILK